MIYLTLKGIKRYLRPREAAAHKGDFGHVLVLGGDHGMGGAVRMAAEAAARVGAGLVSVATRLEHVAVVSAARPELMCHCVTNVTDLKLLLAKATVVIVGPGLGRSEWSAMLLEAAENTAIPKVLDADALNLLAENPRRRDDWILTPHAGEAARLLGCEPIDIQADREKAAHDLQEKYGGVCVLKGAGTLILGEDAEFAICKAGNPGMASGGMGDILSGVIGGLLAQGLSLKHAACVGVTIHAVAGDLAAKEMGERGLLATDLLPHLQRLVNP